MERNMSMWRNVEKLSMWRNVEKWKEKEIKRQKNYVVETKKYKNQKSHCGDKKMLSTTQHNLDERNCPGLNAKKKKSKEKAETDI